MAATRILISAGDGRGPRGRHCTVPPSRELRPLARFGRTSTPAPAPACGERSEAGLVCGTSPRFCRAGRPTTEDGAPAGEDCGIGTRKQQPFDRDLRVPESVRPGGGTEPIGPAAIPGTAEHTCRLLVPPIAAGLQSRCGQTRVVGPSKRPVRVCRGVGPYAEATGVGDAAVIFEFGDRRVDSSGVISVRAEWWRPVHTGVRGDG
jgi:hypothetical protein